MLAGGAFNALASAQLADELRLLGHGVAAGKFAVTRSVGGVNGFAMELGNEDMEDGVQNRLGRTLKKIREADKNASLAKADGAIDVGKAVETDLKLGDGSAGTQLTVCQLKDLGKVGGHLIRKSKPRIHANQRE